ncbi:poly(A) ribonuclease Pop2p [Monosporozyma unispora]|nr:hypothetical protein C6P44_000326 [Kazachstania unispora]
MQASNVQPHVMPMGSDQFFNQNQPNDQPNMGMGMPQMFSQQVNRTGILPQQPGMLPNMQAMGNNQEPNNQYVLNKKIDPLVAQQLLNQVAGQGNQSQGQQPQQQGQQNFNMPVGGMPPRLNAYQQQQLRQQGQMPLQQQPQQPQQQQQGQGQGVNMGQPMGNPQMPRQMNMPNSMGPMPPMLLPPPNHLFIREVWKNNLYSEFNSIRRLLSQYKYVSISTEFVGTLARPIGNFRSREDYHYQTMRANVDLLNPVQLGISLSDVYGNKPENEPSTWQFNLEFDVNKEMISGESLELLRKSGINYEMHKNIGVSKFEFAQLMIDSGLLMDENITWITYHAAYDLGFLINILMNDIMPNNRKDFEWWIHKYMPNLFDLNLIYKVVRGFKYPPAQGKLQQQVQQPSMEFTLTNLADDVGLPRFPVFTTTGGQSLLMLLSFCQLNKISMHTFPDGTDFDNVKNVIYGIED